MSAAPIPALIDTLDSFYQWILNNVSAINSSRKFGGIVDAKDWPPKVIKLEVPYLAILRDSPIRTKPQSFYAPLMGDLVEWRWTVEGDNIPANAQASNRGDKYRTNMQIMQELLSAHNPGYAPKQQWNVAADSNNNPVRVGVSYNPPEYFWWTIPSFVRKQDRQSGMLWTVGQVEISCFAPVSLNLG
jgi:hypothetical protein